MIIYTNKTTGYSLNISWRGFSWIYSGSPRKTLSQHTDRMRGFSFNDVLVHWLRTQYPKGIYVVLYDINPTQKPSDFWRSLPPEKARILISDVVVLRCDRISEMQDLCASISTEFASAIGWVDGNIADWNWE